VLEDLGVKIVDPVLARVGRLLSDPVLYLKWSRTAARSFRVASRQKPSEPATGFETPSRAEVYLAHPDDETFCSGLLCELVARGAQVHLVCLTRGEGGRTGGRSREDLATVREAEMRAASRELGAASVDFLGFIDPTPTRFRLYAPEVSVNELASLISRRLRQSKPEWIITHGSGGEYWHPAHILLHRAVARACTIESRQRQLEGGRGPVFVTFNAWHESSSMPRLLNRDDIPTLCLDVSAHASQRLRMMMAHETQATQLESWAGSFENFVGLANPEYYRINTCGELPQG
jgi:N-acetylglucosamine malate deacetylase 2